MELPQQCEPENEEQIVFDILSTVAAAEGTGTCELRPRLNDALDPDALGRFLQATDGPVSVRFAYHGWTVEARGTGEVEIRNRSDDG